MKEGGRERRCAEYVAFNAVKSARIAAHEARSTTATYSHCESLTTGLFSRSESARPDLPRVKNENVNTAEFDR